MRRGLPERPATWQDVGKGQTLSGPIYRDAPAPDDCTTLVVYLVNVTVRTTDDRFTLVPVSEFFGTYKEAEADLDALRVEQPDVAAVAGIHAVCLLFRHDSPEQMVELADYRQQLAREMVGMQ